MNNLKEPKHPTSRLNFWLGGVAVIVVIVGVLFFKGTDDQTYYQGPKENITIGAGQGAFLVWIAERQVFFDDAGLNTDIRFYKSGKAAANGMTAGEVNIATSADFVLVKKSFTERDIRAVASIKRGYSIRLIARRDNGIETPSDLKGKKVGATLGSASEFFLGRFLIFNGLVLDDIEIVGMAPKEISEAVVEGVIDAAFIWEPHIYNAGNKLGDKAIVTSGQGKQEFHMLMLGKDGWIKPHPSAVERLLKALVRAQDFIRENPEQSRTIIQKKFEYDPDYLEYVETLQEHNVELPQSLITLLEDQARWAINNDIVQGNKMPNYLNFLSFKVLESVEPDAVTVIR